MSRSEFLKQAFELGRQLAQEELTKEARGLGIHDIWNLGRYMREPAERAFQSVPKAIPRKMEHIWDAGRTMREAQPAVSRAGVAPKAKPAPTAKPAPVQAVGEGVKKAPKPESRELAKVPPKKETPPTPKEGPAAAPPPVSPEATAEAAKRLESVRAMPDLEERARAMEGLIADENMAAGVEQVRRLGSRGGYGFWGSTALPVAGAAGLGYLADDERGALAGAGLALGGRLGASPWLSRARELRGIHQALGRTGAPSLAPIGWKSPEATRSMIGAGALGLGGAALGGVLGNRIEKPRPWYENLYGLVPPTVGAVNQVALPYMQMRRGIDPNQVLGYEQQLGLTPPMGQMPEQMI